MMNELEWQAVLYGSKNQDVPKERWGHRIVKAGEQLLMFGGYGGIKEGAGSYLNDLWSFSLQTYKWEQLKTEGDLPEARSNYTIHYWA
jgi:N-acetylneuraminic acid mutarotase